MDSLDKQIYGIGGNLYFVRNFKSSKASLQFFDGKDISGRPFYELKENTANSDWIKITPSYANVVTVVLKVDINCTKDFPSFIYYATGSEQRLTTTLAPTTSKAVGSTTTPTTPVPVHNPVIAIQPSASDNITPVIHFEGDIALILDLGSQNISKVIETAYQLIYPLDINPSFVSNLARVNIIVYKNGTARPYAWNLPKEHLFYVLQNIQPEIDEEIYNSQITSFGSFLNTLFDETNTLRRNVQKVAILITDNDNQFNETISSEQDFDSSDIHPVLLNINTFLRATTNFTKTAKTFSGSISNQLILKDYAGPAEFLQTVLFNPATLCNIETVLMMQGLFNGTIFRFPLPASRTSGLSNQRYCNNIILEFYCRPINSENPIIVHVNSAYLEPEQDFVKIYGEDYDGETLFGVFSGFNIVNSTLSVPDVQFIRVLFQTNSNKIYQGIDIAFGNCITTLTKPTTN
uniref:VWFA domain-containing protein n=1 Tax=Rhabditophanes sp. KR3021 TaxID=114890 RepID=A0AC35TV72_9BILA